MRLIIVRHGETDWTLSSRYTGAIDVPLTANGRREASQLTSLLDQADASLRAKVENRPGPVIVVTHGHFSRILTARAPGLPAEYGRLFASVPASVSLIEDHHGERCIGLWNADTSLIEHLGKPRSESNEQVAATPVSTGGRLR